MNNEIPKNTLNVPSAKVEQPVKPEQEAVKPQTAETPAKEIKEIPDNPANRAAVKADNLENDIKIFTANPDLVEKACLVADFAKKKYEEAGLENPEAKALAVSRTFVEEFQK